MTTSTQRLPIKAHELGWELSPIDLVMANSVLEPVFSDDQKQQRGARDHETSSYLTESPYLATLGLAKPPPRSGKSLEDAEISLTKGQLIDKPTLPVLDTRRANFLLVNGRKRSKTGRKLPNSSTHRSRSKDNRGSRPRFGQKTSQKTGHQQKQKKKKCEHDADDILWRETVSHQNFVTTSPHPFIRSDDTSTTETPMMDISPFLQPPALSGISDNDNHHLQEHQEESQEDSQALLQSALGQVKADVISQQSRRHPPSGPKANKKGKFVVRGKIRFKNRKKKGRSSSSVFQDKKSSANV